MLKMRLTKIKEIKLNLMKSLKELEDIANDKHSREVLYFKKSLEKLIKEIVDEEIDNEVEK